MTAAKTFLLDFDFDDVKLMEKVMKEDEPEKYEIDQVSDSEPEKIVPTYSENDLEIARQEGFEAGKESGMTETQTGIDNTIFQTLTSIDEKFSDLHNAQQELNNQTKIDAILLVQNIIEKLFPSVATRLSIDEAIHFSETLLPQIIHEPNIIISVADGIANPLNEKLQVFLNNKKYGGKLSVLGIPNFSPGDCKIEWSNGKSERDISNVLENIEESFLNAVNNLAPQIAPDEKNIDEDNNLSDSQGELQEFEVKTQIEQDNTPDGYSRDSESPEYLENSKDFEDQQNSDNDS